jgi:uncharacterized repeat protein (TIGR02543 family)
MFDPNNGETAWGTSVAYGGLAEEPVPAPERDGHLFAGWFNGEAGHDFDSEIYDNITLTAMWDKLWTVNVVANSEKSIEYSVSLRGRSIEQDTFDFGPAGGEKPISVPHGSLVAIWLTSTHSGYDVGWHDGSELQYGMGYSIEVTGDTEVVISLMKSDPPSSPWAWITIVFFALLFLLIFLDDDDEEVIGKVTCNGKGIPGVKIVYLEKDSKRRTVTTDKDGDYAISAEIGSIILLTDAVKNGYVLSEAVTDHLTVTEIPIRLEIRKEVTRVDLMLSKTE